MVQVNSKRIGLLLGSIIVVVLFSVSFFHSFTPADSITGYVVANEGIRISTQKLDPLLINEIQRGNYNPKIIVLLDDTPGEENKDIEKEIIALNQERVLDELSYDVHVEKIPRVDDEDEFKIYSKNIDFAITHEFETINAIAGTVHDAIALKELSEQEHVTKILYDYPVEVNLANSIPRIDANDVWNINVGKTNITGEHQSVCIIDTGVDYTHSALGNCTPTTYLLNGTLLKYYLESDHPYANSEEKIWQVTMPGFTNIALHFVNISLENMSAGDTLDRVYIMDADQRTVATYKEYNEDVWTPSVKGDTIFIKLVTDGSIVADGFHIDLAINGTTNKTMDWSSCTTVKSGWDMYNNDADPMDDHGHGSHVAGTIVSQNDVYKGVAPAAQIIALKALSSTGTGYSSDIAASIDWCNSNANEFNITAISMSLGCGGNGCVHYQTTCGDDITAVPINNSYHSNISVFIASGNSGWTNGISNPACAPHAIPVGAIHTNDNILYNRGNLLRILAPGTSIHSTTTNNGWQTMSGTSMATPHAAGSAVLLNHYAKLTYGRFLTPDEMHDELALRGSTLYDSSSLRNYSRINVLSSISPVIQSFSGPTFGTEYNTTNFTLLVDTAQRIEQAKLVWMYPNESQMNYSMTSLNKSSYEFTMLSLPQGNHSYEIVVEGVGGIKTITDTVNFSINLVDLSLNVTLPVQNSSHRNVLNVSYLARGTDLSMSNMTISINGDEVFSNVTLVDSPSTLVSILVDSTTWVHGNYSGLITLTNLNQDQLTSEFTFDIDKIGPIISSVQPSPAYPYQGDSVTFITNIEGSNTSFVSWRVNETWYNESIESNNATVSLSNHTGILYYQVHSYDTLGNRNHSPIKNVNYTSITAQMIITPVESQVFEAGVQELFNATSNLTGEISYVWNVSSDLITNESFMYSLYALGTHTIELTASNGLVNQTDTITIEVNDTLPPNITNTSHTSSPDISTLTNYTIWAEDVSDVDNITISHAINSSLHTCETADDLMNCTFNLSGFQLGENNITVTAIDSQGNAISQIDTINATACFDNLQNGDETGVDCGGGCAACSSDAPFVEIQSSGAGGGGGGGGGSNEATDETSSKSSNVDLTDLESSTVSQVEAVSSTQSIENQSNTTSSRTSEIESETETEEINSKKTLLLILAGIIALLAAIYAFMESKSPIL